MVSTTLESELQEAVRTMVRVVRDAVPGKLSGEEAGRLVALFAQAERAASSGIARCAPVVSETGTYAKAGHASAADWLGALSGSSASAAKGRLTAAARAAAHPDLARALGEGDLSASQLKVVSDAAAADPTAPETLLPLVAGSASHQELADTAARLRAAGRCQATERARRERVRALRHLRWHQDPAGGVRGEFLCDEAAWARVEPLIEARASARWRDGAASTGGDTLDALRLDAFLDMLAARGGSGAGARPHTLVLVDAQALRRGTARGDELCEIEGIGPVSVDAVTELIGEGALQFLVRDGTDVRTVTSSTRVLAQRAQMALVARDRICAVPGCGKRLGLQKDHWQLDFTKGGETSLANLARLCAAHHDLKTHGGWRLEGGPGHWVWNPPLQPPSAGYIKRARKLAAAKARRE